MITLACVHYTGQILSVLDSGRSLKWVGIHSQDWDTNYDEIMVHHGKGGMCPLLHGVQKPKIISGSQNILRSAFTSAGLFYLNRRAPLTLVICGTFYHTCFLNSD
jgi:hypothetical protein